MIIMIEEIIERDLINIFWKYKEGVQIYEWIIDKIIIAALLMVEICIENGYLV
jgi:hypothetical protein